MNYISYDVYLQSSIFRNCVVYLHNSAQIVEFVQNNTHSAVKEVSVMQSNVHDHRVRVTKMLIQKSLTNLLKKKPIQSISIKELCSGAGINRGTFYSHYTDIYDLMQNMQAEMLDNFRKALESLLSKDTKDLTALKITTGIFQCLKDNEDLCTVTLGEYGDKVFTLRLISVAKEKYLESYSHYFTGVSAQKLEYFYAFNSAGCIGLLQKWLTDSLVTPVEEVAATAEEIMMSGIGYLKKSK